MKRRIAFLINDLKAGGAEKQLFLLASSLVERKFEVHLITLREGGIYEEELKKSNVILHSLGIKGRLELPVAIFRLVKLLHKIKPDILQTFLFYSDIMGRFVKLFVRLPILINSMRNTDDWRDRLHVLLDRYTSSVPDTIVSNSIAGGLRLIKVEKIPHQKIKIIRNGIEGNNATSAINLREVYNISDDCFLFGSIGRFHSQKNFPMMIEAFHKFNQRFQKSKLIIVGGGREETKLKKIIENYGLEGKVFLYNEPKNAKGTLSSFDCFLLSSRYEGLPNVIMEAAIHNLPVLSTDVGGVRELVKNDRYGIVVPQGNIAEFVKGMEKFYIDEKYRKSSASTLREHILKHFSVDKLINSHIALYDSLLNKRPNKILMIITKSDRGGAQKHVADLSVELKNRGYKIHLAAGRGGELFEFLKKRK